jgi:membrane complex biogenesis BtpA family protein
MTPSMTPLLPEWSRVRVPVIGMVHLQPLPGSPRFGGNVDAVRAAAVRDAELLAGGGVNGIMVENYGDVPFHPGPVPAHVVASMTALAGEIRRAVPDVPIGINVLRNDGCAALAVAHAVGARFIRVNVLCGARVTDQGVIQGIAHELMRDRARLGATSVKVFADVDVKHSAPLAPRPISEEVADTVERGLADAVIVSGTGTGRPTDLEQLRGVKQAAGATPVFVGSGATVETVGSYVQHADGLIVGSAFKVDGQAQNVVDASRVRALMSAVR